MEIEKVIRIVAVFIAFAAFAIVIATRWMFPDSTLVIWPIAICMFISLLRIWRDTQKKASKHTNE